MKKLKITLCTLLVLFSGVMFAACGDKDPELETFDVDDIEIVGLTGAEYDQNSHIFTVEYEDVDLVVEYSIDAKETFVANPNLINAGTYEVYYRLSAEGYQTYTSATPVDYTIAKRSVGINLSDVNVGVGVTVEDINFGYDTQTVYGSVLTGDSLDLTYSVADYNKDTAQVGGTYSISAVNNNNNYVVEVTNGTLNIVGSFNVGTSYYETLQDAVDNVEDGGTIKLVGNAVLNSAVVVDKTITIDGQGKYAIVNDENFSDRQMISLTAADKTLTLKNVTLNGSLKSRVVYASAGTVVVDGATITGGKVSDSYIGGVYISHAARFNMTSGTIVGNEVGEDYADDNYTQYSADLWIGANAKGEINSTMDGGRVGNLFINANTFSETNPGDFIMNGGTISNVYVEYDGGYGAKLVYNSGLIGKLMLSTLVSGESVEVTATPNTYNGGVVATANVAGVETAFTSQQAALEFAVANPDAYIKAFLAGRDMLNAIVGIEQVDEIVLIADTSLATNFVVTRELTLNLNGKKLYNTTDIWDTTNKVWSLISVREGGNLTITGNGSVEALEDDCYAVDVRDGGELVIENGTFIGNITAVYAHSGFVTINDGTFDVQQVSPQTGDSRYTLNCLDANLGTTANIVVNGGEFANYNPAESNSENPAAKFVAEGLTTEASEADANDDIWYTVVAETQE